MPEREPSVSKSLSNAAVTFGYHSDYTTRKNHPWHWDSLNLTMNSLGSDCNELKKQYDACFNAWFSGRFLRGDTDDSMCSQMFKVYQECVKKAMEEHKIEFREIEGDYTTGDFKSSSDKTNS